MSMPNLVKTSSPGVSNLRQLLHSIHYFPKIALAIRKFKKMKELAQLGNEIWSFDLAYVDKLA